MKTIGQAMKNARETAGLTVAELSEKSGIHRNSIWAYESDRHTPNAFALIELSETLGISIDEYLGLQNGGER